jgi:hypothetical protein
MDTPEHDHAAAMLAIRRLTAQRAELLGWAYDATRYDFRAGAAEFRNRIVAGEFGPMPQAAPTYNDYSTERRAALGPEGLAALKILSAAADLVSERSQRLTLEQACSGLDADRLRALVEEVRGAVLTALEVYPEYVAVDGKPEPDGSVQLDALILELGMDPADFERTPAQRQAVDRVDAASDRLSGRGQPRRIFLVYDCDQVVSAHLTQQGAEAARLAHQDRLRATMGEDWNPSYDEAIEVFPMDLRD